MSEPYFKYEGLILPYIEGKYTISEKGELTCSCPFHWDEHPSFSANLETGLYTCHACRRERKYNNIYI